MTFDKVLPRNFTKIYGNHLHHALPVLSTDYEEKALVDDLNAMNDKMVACQSPFCHTATLTMRVNCR